MKKRNPLAVIFLPIITLGIYQIYWAVKTKGEMVAKGASIPTSWLLIVPFVNIWWLWKYCEGVEHVTGGKMSVVVSFLLWFVLGCIGAGIIQNEFNKVGAQPEDPAPEAAAPAPSTDDSTQATPPEAEPPAPTTEPPAESSDEPPKSDDPTPPASPPIIGG